jgi:pimeloyl-ACP methyl ester carboxylesterase
MRQGGAPEPIELRCPLGESFDPGAHVAASVFLPDGVVGPAPGVLCCLPGGGLTRRYYDLRADGDDSYSFARCMSHRGFIVITCDMIGTGESSRPADGFSITPDLIAEANHRAIAHTLGLLRTGTLDARIAPLPDLLPVGVGHSLGAVSTIVQQSMHRDYRALVLLGYGGKGFPSELNEAELALAGDPDGIRARVVRLARARYAEPYYRIVASPRTREVYGAGGDKGAMSALRAAGTPLLATAGLFSMIPASVRRESLRIDVPVFLGLGDRDICGPPHEVPACFPAARNVALIVLGDTGHTHFVFRSMRSLLRHVAAWLEASLAPEED